MFEHKTKVVSFENNGTKAGPVTELKQPARDEIELSAVFAALGDPVRLAMVRELHECGEASCGELAADMPKSTRSHHLKVLREAGVTWTRTEGVMRHVRLRYDCLNERFPGLLDAVLHQKP